MVTYLLNTTALGFWCPLRGWTDEYKEYVEEPWLLEEEEMLPWESSDEAAQRVELGL